MKAPPLLLAVVVVVVVVVGEVGEVGEMEVLISYRAC